MGEFIFPLILTLSYELGFRPKSKLYPKIWF